MKCPRCGDDITESVNRFLAGRAARASLLKRSKEYYVDLAKKRWAKKKTTEAEKE